MAKRFARPAAVCRSIALQRLAEPRRAAAAASGSFLSHRFSCPSYNKISRSLIVLAAALRILTKNTVGEEMIGVVIPVHNEEVLLGACLQSVRQATADRLLDAEPVEIVVVLDACTDRSAAIAVRHQAQIVSLDARCVGAARALGATLALDYGARWIAFTDADTIVPANWLSAQLDHEADATCGQVRIDDWSGYPVGRVYFLQRYSATAVTFTVPTLAYRRRRTKPLAAFRRSNAVKMRR